MAAAVTVLFFATQAYLIAAGKDLIWQTDTKPEYINFLFWAKGAIEELVSTFLEGGGIVVPMYTYSLGYGADAIVSMGSYLQDPLNLIMLAFPEDMVGFSYPLTSWVRLYLAAVAFSLFCFGRGHGRKATAVAALVYLTCGFILYLGVLRHGKFIDWAILLPLALRAADLIFNRESRRRGGVLFVVVLFFQFMTSVYYLYMTCLVLLAYCLIKYFLLPRNRSFGGFVKLVALFLGLGILAFLLSAPFSVPQIQGLLSQGRVTGGRSEVELVFSLAYYLRIPVHLIGADANTEGMICCGVGLLLVLAFAFGRRHYEAHTWRAWMVAAAICAVGLLVPAFGSVMNGMGYSTDRWMLVMGFVGAYISCLAVPKLSALDAREWKRIGIVVALVVADAIVYVLAMYVRDGTLDLVVWPLVMAAAFVVSFLVIRHVSRTGGGARRAAVLGVLVIVCASLSTCIYCSSVGAHWVGSYSKPGTIYNALEVKSPAVAVEQLDDDGLYRYSEPRVQKTKNSALAHEPTMGIDYYTSYYNQAIDDFRQELGISDHHMNFSYCGSDSRLALENLAGVKYYVTAKADRWRVPYGFTDTGVKYRSLYVYENENPVPLAFLAPGVIGTETYDALSMVQKQEALLQGAVVDADEVSSDVEEVRPETASEEVPFTVVAQDGVSCEDGVFHVLKTDATITIDFTGLPASETYLTFEGLSYAGYNPSKRIVLQGGEVGKRQIFGDLFWSERTTYPITASIGDRSKTIEPATPQHRRYGGKTDWVLNLGYADEAATQMTITFSYMGDYRYNGMEVVCQPIEPIVENSEALAAAGLDGLELHRNGFSAQATLDSDDPRIAVFTIAYGSGWSVSVDGQPAKALKTDTGFLGVEVRGAGTHDIAWQYETPGLRTGAWLFLVGIALAVVAGIVSRRRRRDGIAR